MTAKQEGPREREFLITITFENYLPVSSLWPDGDAPSNPTVADVERLIKVSGGATSVLRDWNLDTDPHVAVERADEATP